MSHYKPYSTYVESGVEWIGEVPEHWAISPVKSVYALRNGFPFSSELFTSNESDSNRLIRIRDILGNNNLTFTEETCPDTARVRNGDVLIGMDGDFNVVMWDSGSAKLNQRVCAINGANALWNRYFYYCIPTPLKVINDLTFSTTVKHLSSNQVLSVRLPVPPDREVGKIVAFLDRETARIDALIEKKQRQIELLKEKRQAIITQAVTKGLDPDVPMKDSGVEWLGEVPEHWGVKRLKHIVPEITVGIVVTPAKYYVDTGVPCLRSLNVSSGSINPTNLVYISEESNQLHSKSIIYEGDTVVVRTGQTGTPAVVSKQFHGANCIDLLIVRKSKMILPEFLHHVLTSDFSKTQVEAHSVGAIQAHYNTSTLSELVLLLPSLHEQEEILERLKIALERIDAVSQHAKRSIDLLKERRSALITAAVTGQIDVRGEV